MPICTSYQLGGLKFYDKKVSYDDKVENLIDKGINLLIGFLSIKQIGTVSAKNMLYCCPKTKEGANCQEVFYKDNQTCVVDLVPTRCSQYTECNLGCCIDQDEGLCINNVPKYDCENNGGVWDKSSSCLINECKRGCCVLGSDVQFVTENRCEKLSIQKGFQFDFKSKLTMEIECLALKETQKKGACIFYNNLYEKNESDKSCAFLTELECVKNKGDFFEDHLCSNPLFETNCTNQESIGCIKNRDEIFWFDSCGNRENIYNSDKEASWNNGYVLSKLESCNSDNGNQNSENCGNCNYLLGSKCSKFKKGVKDGDYICKNMDCIDAQGNERKNGESWCYYEGDIGNARDLVGSRHWKRMCINGEIKVEPCYDYRNEICTESKIEIDNKTKETVSVASCIVNKWQACMAETGCRVGSNDCKTMTFDLSSQITPIQTCLPEYPPGWDMSTGKGRNVAKDICNQASFMCRVVFEKKADWDAPLKSWEFWWMVSTGSANFLAHTAKEGYWECIHNCECLNQDFVDKMHQWCTYSGDCGHKMNIAGKTTKNEYTSQNLPLSKDGAVGSLSKKNMLYPKPDSIRVMKSIAGGSSSKSHIEMSALEQDQSDFMKWTGIGSTAMGGLGTIMMVFKGSYSTASWIIGGAVKATNVILGIGDATKVGVGSAGTTTVGVEGGIPSGLEGSATTDFTSGSGMLGGDASGVGSSVPTAESLGTPTTIGTVTPFLNFIGGLGAMMSVSTILIKVYGLKGDASVAMTIAGIAAGIAMGIILVIAGEGLISYCLGPQWIVCLAIVAYLAFTAWIMSFYDIGDIEYVDVEFRCYPWEAPPGGKDCSKCDADPLLPCSKYRCESLGQNCEMLNPGSNKGKCVNINSGDKTAPKIEPFIEAFSPEYKAIKFTDGFSLEKVDSKCIQEFSPIVFGLKLNEHAQCKISMEKTLEWDKMDYFEGKNFYEKEHIMTLIMPSLESLGQFGLSYNATKKFEYYVKCMDKNGNLNKKSYVIKMCLSKQDDLTPVKINKFDPDRPILAHKKESLNFSMFIYEPAECKYSTNDTDYFNMEWKLNCSTNVFDVGLYGWSCNGEIQNIKKYSTYYFRCLDQPWYNETDNKIKRNANVESIKYYVGISETPLKIDSVLPSGEFSFGVEPVTIQLETETSGGAEFGDSMCEYSFDNENFVRFFETFSDYHKQTFDMMLQGDYNIFVKCTDIAENKAYSQTSFKIDVDIIAPEVVRAYRQGDKLKIATNEKSECYYSDKKCNFNIENSTSMTNGYSATHSAEWNPSKTYYVRCKDIWGNGDDTCSIKISPGMIN